MSAVADQIRAAREAGAPVRVRGAGTWMDAGRPTQTAQTISLGGDRGIVEYVPGDLTLTARAGTTIAELVTAVNANGQWLPLDPWGGDDGTLGATISTATAGPHAFAMGLPRDVVLGMEFVSGTGDTVRAGGRVVKNVAGFDLTRLLVGSWGTLGIITEVTVRLRARPPVTRTLAIDVGASETALNAIAVQLRALPFTPLASELVNRALAFQLGAGEQTTLFVRLGGNERSVAGQLDLLEPLGVAREFEERVWPALRCAEPRDAGSWRWSQLPARFGGTWAAAERATCDTPDALLHGNPASGVVRCVVPANAASARAATTFNGTVAIERLPKAQWANVPHSNLSADLARTIRSKFDPGGILNRGILRDMS